MRTSSVTLAVTTLLLTSVARAAPGDAVRRVGVIAVGADAAAAGELQRELELRLAAAPRVTLRGGNDLAPVIGRSGLATAAAGPDAQKLRDGADLLQKASDAYYEDRAAFALDRLGALGALHERAGNFPVAEHVRLLLWRTAVFLALKDEPQAEAEALAALTLSPELKVDLNEFRPSVKEMVDKVRGRGLRMVTVVVNGLPAGATLRLDDRAVTPRFQAPTGKHRLVASAAGRRDVGRTFDAAGDLSIPMTLPIALDPSLDAALSGIVWRGQPSTQDVPLLAGLATRLGVDWLVVAATRSDPASESRVVVLSPSGGPVFASPQLAIGAGTNAALATWTDSRLASELTGAAAAVAVATPSPVPTATPAPAGTPVAVAIATPRPRPAPTAAPHFPPARRHAASSEGVVLGARGGLLWLDRTRTISGGGESFKTGFGGVGPRITADASRGMFFGELEAAFLSYGISTLDVKLPDGSKKTVGGGSSLVARLGGGWRHAFGRGDWDGSPLVRAGLGVVHESHSAEDVKDASNQSLKLLTSYDRNGLELRVDGRFPFPDVSFRPAITGGLAVGPAIGFSESPKGATGTSPAAGPEFGAHLGVELAPLERLGVAFEILASMRDTKFKGTAQAPLSTAIRNATMSESFQGAALTARYRF